MVGMPVRNRGALPHCGILAHRHEKGLVGPLGGGPGRVDPDQAGSARRNSRAALVPPNPKEFDKA